MRLRLLLVLLSPCMGATSLVNVVRRPTIREMPDAVAQAVMFVSKPGVRKYEVSNQIPTGAAPGPTRSNASSVLPRLTEGVVIDTVGMGLKQEKGYRWR